MDPLIYVAAATLVAFVIILITLLKKSSKSDKEDAPAEPVVARPARQVEMAGGMRRRAPRRRMGARPGAADASDSDEDIDETFIDQTGEGKKIGAKKMKKLEEKAEKKAMREAAEEERMERKQREALLEEERKKSDERREAEEKAREKQEELEKEEQEKREHEEYLKLKEAFSVEEEGTHEAELNQDTESLLQEFINYIKDMKVVMLEDLAGHFRIKTQDAIDRINTLLEESKLSGVMDDRGKFIYITQEEYEAVAKFIKQRGRVSISELAESSNRLINLNPENLDTHKRLVGGIHE